MHVYAQNAYCDEWNEKMLTLLPGHEYTNEAKDSKKDNCTDLAKVEMSNNYRDTGNLKKTLHIKEGAKVMITTNIDVSDGLTNGAMGSITNVVVDDTRKK